MLAFQIALIAFIALVDLVFLIALIAISFFIALIALIALNTVILRGSGGDLKRGSKGYLNGISIRYQGDIEGI